MEARGWMMLRVLINRYNSQAGNALLRFLPQPEAELVLKQEIQSNDLTPLLEHPEHLIKRMHYSWLQPLLAKWPESVRPLIIEALTPEQASRLKQGVSQPSERLADPIKAFILHRFYHSFDASEHLPIEYLPPSEFSSLLNWNKKELVNLFDFLGLYDLAVEIRHIVNRNYLRNFYDCLTSRQLTYLKICMHQKQQITAPKLGIDPSSQNCTLLKQILHRRGLVRLAKALTGQHKDFVWYIAHTLDSGRGTILLQAQQTPASPKVVNVLKQQVFNVMNFLKKE